VFGRPSRRRLAIAGAIPDGSTRARSAGAFLRVVAQHPDAALLRTDAYRNLMAVAWVLARYADWASWCARPTWAVLCDRTGLGRSTVARHLRALREWGLIGVVETGSTEATRQWLPEGHPDRVEGNRAAEYVLCTPRPAQPQVIPVVEGSETPSLLRQEEREHPSRKRASEPGRNPTDQTPCPQGPRRAALELCRQLREHDLTLRRISDRMLRHLLGSLLALGATASDVRHVLHHSPDGTAWPYAATPAHVPGWIRWRLSHWITPDGTLRAPLPSTAAAERQAHARAEQASRRAQKATERRSATTDPNSHAAAARALLIATSPGARRVIERRATSSSKARAGAA
jgi:DNA-binding transcriptional ArsR family regulator